MTKEKFSVTFKNGAKAAGKALLTFMKRNYLMCAYVVASVFIELTAIAVTANKFYMTSPWIFIILLAFCCLISQYLPGHKSRYALFFIALAAHIILDLIFIIVYDSTGGTVFDYAMLNLREDAMRILEVLPLSFTYIFVSGLLFALYAAVGFIYTRKIDKPPVTRASVAVTSSLMSTVFMAMVFVSHYNNYMFDSNDLSYKLYQPETGTYSNKGIIGNFYNELVRGLWFSDIDVGDTNELYEYIYKGETAPTDHTGDAEGYNVVTILCESFEWFTFLYDAELYPNGYAKPVLDGDKTKTADEAQIKQYLHELFPNMYRIYESQSTVVLNNAHSLEKTDISENKVLIGNYPLFEYINYSYPTNAMPFSMPNMLKGLFGVESNSFHNGYKTFYNRNEHQTVALGFNSFTAAEDIYPEDDELGGGGVGERNLDSVMFDTCKKEMFPTDRRFYSHIVTITQHGQYAYRTNLQEYYDKLDKYGILPYDENDEDANALRFYCAAGMDTDKALGIMLDYLDENGLADNTLIAMFGDHNAYYQGISNYVKNIYSPDHQNYTELYRVPVMIKVGNRDMGNTVIDKFTCVTDIYPTILDLLGITGFSNLMYGTSAFDTSTESILYSRAYDKFLNDKIFFNSLSSVTYKALVLTEEDLENIELRAKILLSKISHINRLYAGDYFKGVNTEEYYRKLREANSELLAKQNATKRGRAA